MIPDARRPRFAPRQIRTAAGNWLARRIKADGVLRFLQKKTVPLHRHSSWYYWGNAVLTLFMVQVLTGIALLFHYQPTPDTAFESVRTIVLDARFGWWIRSVHAWSANIMVGAAFVHLFSAYFLKSYRRPRELTWLSGMGMCFILLGFGFSGYLLPWNELSFFATKVGTGIVETTPLVGHFLKIFLRGGEEVGGSSLTRFFAIHVAVLPSLMLALLAAHLFLVQVHGMSLPPSLETRPTVKTRAFFPEFVLREAAVACLLIAVVVSLAALFPCEVGQKADPMQPTPPDIRPEWYFLFMYEALQWLPAKIGPWDGGFIGVFLFSGLFAVLFAIPFLDRSPAHGRSGRFWRFAGAGFAAFLLITTFLATREAPDETASHSLREAATESETMSARNADTAPSVDEEQKRKARDSMPALVIFLTLALATACFLWVKSRDIETLRKRGFFDS
ncbi:MAG: cytochrome bc complex cytochrome b subunit [Vicinamibacteria bacterium]|nr:cytochrome bc complex cytochrome b subunit [Vicinamibacteria bacterium]